MKFWREIMPFCLAKNKIMENLMTCILGKIISLRPWLCMCIWKEWVLYGDKKYLSSYLLFLILTFNTKYKRKNLKGVNFGCKMNKNMEVICGWNQISLPSSIWEALMQYPKYNINCRYIAAVCVANRIKRLVIWSSLLCVIESMPQGCLPNDHSFHWLIILTSK